MIKKILLTLIGISSFAAFGQTGTEVTRNKRKVVIIQRTTSSDTQYQEIEDSALRAMEIDLEEYADQLEDLIDSMEKIVIILPSDNQNSGNSGFQVDIGDSQMVIQRKKPGKPKKVIHSGYTYIGAASPRGADFGNVEGFPELNNFKSIHLGFNKQLGLNLIKGKLRVWTGIQYDISNLRFSNSNRVLTPNGTFEAGTDSINSNTKSKVVTNYLGVPLAIGYQSNPHDDESGFWIKGGVSASYRVRTHSKTKTNNGEKKKQFNSFGFNDFSLMPFIEGGYNSLGFYFRYGVLPLFKKDNPTGNMVQFGVVIK